MKIRNLVLPRGAYLAPMAGITDLPFRILCHEMGCAYTVSEMISARGFLCAPENRRAVQALLVRAPQEGPVGLQLFGHEPEYIAGAIAELEGLGFAAFDLNMGCPAPKITGGGEGSALLRNLPLAEKIIRAARKSTEMPLTVKMRLGWDQHSIVALEFAQMVQESGADAVCVHGRTREQMYSGQADWEMIRRIKQALHIPVIGNGDIQSAQDAMDKMEYSGCDGVMIGRGAMGNPWIFRQIQDALEGREVYEPGGRERGEMLLRHARMLCAWKGESCGVREMRKHAGWYLKGLHGAAKMRPALMNARTIKDLEETVALLD